MVAYTCVGTSTSIMKSGKTNNKISEGSKNSCECILKTNKLCKKYLFSLDTYKLSNIGLCTKYLFCIWIGIGLRHSDGVPSEWESCEGVRHCDVVFMLYRRYICRTYKTCLVVKVYQIKVYRNPGKERNHFHFLFMHLMLSY